MEKFFFNLAEPHIRATCELLVANIIALINNTNEVAVADLVRGLPNVVGFIFNRVYGGYSDVDVLTIVHNIMNTGTHIIASYVEGQGIRADWLTAFLNMFNSDWARELIRQLVEFRK